MFRRLLIFSICLFPLILSGCAHPLPPDSLKITEKSVALRDTQTRYFATRDEKMLLEASLKTLQDLGFIVDSTEESLGVIVASKTRDATELKHIAGAAFLALLGMGIIPVNHEQHIKVSVVTTPYHKSQIKMRVSFQRVIWNTHGKISKTETLDQPELYDTFFAGISKNSAVRPYRLEPTEEK